MKLHDANYVCSRDKKFDYVVMRTGNYLKSGTLHEQHEWTEDKNDAFRFSYFEYASSYAEELEAQVFKIFPDGYMKPLISFEHV
jgi:hypothetical protein